MQLLLLGVAIGMYGIWRFGLRVQGKDYKPEGQWTSRTDAMSEYQRQHPELFPPPTRRTWVMFGSVVLVEAAVVGLIVFLAVR